MAFASLRSNVRYADRSWYPRRSGARTDGKARVDLRKTIHTWHTDQERILPVGSPMIMMGFTKDGQLDKQLLNDRDKRFDISTSSIKNKRSDISKPNIDPAANAWEKGNRNIRQFIITDQVDSAIAKHLKHNLKD